MTERMIYIAILWLTGFSLLASCTRQRTPDTLLIQADSLMEAHPDSALRMLESIEPQQLEEEADRAYYALLLTRARDKNDIAQKDDSLIRIAVQYYDSVGDVPRQAKAHYHWGGVLRDQYNYYHALNEYAHATYYTKRCKNQKLLSLIYNNIANIYYQENHHREADSIYQLLQQQATLQKDTLNLVEALSQRGAINIEKGKAYYQYAESLLLRASEMSKHLSNNMLKAGIASSLSALYSRMQKNEEAIEYAKERLTLLTDTALYAKGYLLLGDTYYNAKQYDSARFYLNKALCTPKYSTRAYAYMRLADIAKDLNDLEKSLELERLYSAYKDSAYSQNFYISPTKLFSSTVPSKAKSDFPFTRWISYICVCILAVGGYLLMKQRKKVSDDNAEKKKKLQEELDVLTKERNALAKEALEHSEVYSKIERIIHSYKKYDKSEEQLDDDDWQRFIAETDARWDKAVTRLMTRCELEKEEVHLCCLLLTDFPVSNLEYIVKQTRNTIYRKEKEILKKADCPSGINKLKEFLKNY